MSVYGGNNDRKNKSNRKGDECVEMEEIGCTKEKIGGDWLNEIGWEMEECWDWEEKENGNRFSYKRTSLDMKILSKGFRHV